MDPYVQLSVVGVPTDRMTMRTPTIQDNGFNPQWNKEFNFEMVMPEFALLAFKVFDERTGGEDDLIAVNVLPVPLLREGCRFVQLCRKDFTVPSEFMHSHLFIHVQMNKGVAPQHKGKHGRDKTGKIKRKSLSASMSLQVDDPESESHAAAAIDKLINAPEEWQRKSSQANRKNSKHDSWL